MQGIDLQLYPKLISPFIAVTLIITICGYLINDYFDFESDQNNQKINKLENSSAYLYAYLAFFVAGFLLAFYIASRIGKPALSLIYIGASALLYLYSSHFKSRPLIGNVVVSLFSAFVLLILLYAEWGAYLEFKSVYPERYDQFMILIFSYAVFAFFISMVREIVKDIEDLTGDKIAGYNTLPIAIGTDRTKVMAMVFGFGLVAVMAMWAYKMLSGAPYYLIVLFLLLCIRMAYLFIKVNGLSNAKDFKNISKHFKWTMLMGLAFLIIYYQWI